MIQKCNIYCTTESVNWLMPPIFIWDVLNFRLFNYHSGMILIKSIGCGNEGNMHKERKDTRQSIKIGVTRVICLGNVLGMSLSLQVSYMLYPFQNDCSSDVSNCLSHIIFFCTSPRIGSRQTEPVNFLNYWNVSSYQWKGLKMKEAIWNLYTCHGNETTLMLRVSTVIQCI